MNGMNFDLYTAMSHFDPAGRPKDPHAHHLTEHFAALRAERRVRWHNRLRRLRGIVAGVVDLLRQGERLGRVRRRLYSTSTVAHVSKQTPPARAMTPIVARPPRPRSVPKTSTNRSESPDDTLCTSS